MIAIDKVFVIAFGGDYEKKRKLFEERIKTMPLAVHVSTEVVEVLEEEAIKDALLKRDLKLSDIAARDGEYMNWQDTSLAIGHWDAWQKALSERHKTILVLEEGFLPSGSHFNTLKTKEPWELMYMGRCSLEGDELNVSEDLLIPGYSNGSFAYVLQDTSVDAFVKSGYNKNMVPVGEFLTSMHDSHPDDDISSMFEGRVKALAPVKDFFTIDEAWSELIEKEEKKEDVYKPLHPSLFNASGDAKAEWVKKYLNTQLVKKEFDLICDEPIDNVYTFPLFTSLFCKEIIEEAEHFGQWTNYREKGHPPIDIMLNSFGFNDIFTSMMQEFLYPAFYHKYQLKGDAWKKMNSQNFIVRYLPDQQAHLGLHNDGSYISMVVGLNTDFEGGGTYFPKFKKLIKHDHAGHAAIHPGFIGYLHGARPVTKGKRYILASFFFIGSKHPFTEGAY